MAKNNKGTPMTATEAPLAPEPVKEVEYGTFTYAQLMTAMREAFEANNIKLVGQLSRLATKREDEELKAKKDALVQKLVETTKTVKTRFIELVRELEAEGVLEGAEGVWFAYDFLEKVENGINPSCKLVKGKAKVAGEGGGSAGKSAYVSNPAKTPDMLAEVGDEVMFDAGTTRMIDKQEVSIPAGTTYKQAYDLSTNGNWRFEVRKHLLKKTGRI